MKYLVMILALAFAYVANAQTHNAPVTRTCEVKSEVIAPLEGIAGEVSALGDIIKGQVRNYSPKIEVAFSFAGQAGEQIFVTMYYPADVDGVHLVGAWYDGAAYTHLISGTTATYTLVGGFYEELAFLISAVDATGATSLGQKHFEVKCDYSYTGI